MATLPPEHYREDGTCRCNEPEHSEVRRGWKLVKVVHKSSLFLIPDGSFVVSKWYQSGTKLPSKC